MKKEPAYMRLYEQLQKQIVNGSYAYGAKIPSKRDYASEMHVSLITVEHAYELLSEEGYIEPRQRSGYYVSYKEGDIFPVSFETEEVLPERNAPDAQSLPYSVFARTARKVLSDCGEGVLSQSDGRGDIRLRNAAAMYLSRARNMQVKPEQIIIGAGTEYLYTLAAALLGRSRIYGVEYPSYEKIYNIYRSEGIRIDPLKMGKHGIHTSELNRTPATVLHVTPYHSFPSGKSTDAAKRREYIRWAMEKSAYIIEDDYASEFTPSIKAAETLYSLSPEHVIYMNTFTRTISSSIRAGYMVLPESLMEVYEKHQSFRSCTVSEYMQLILAELLNSGDFERHLNRVKRRQRQRGN